MIILLVIAALFIARSVRVINQGEIGIIERLGNVQDITHPGITFVIPILDILKRVDMREQFLPVPEQQIITRDNVGMAVDGIVYVQILDPIKATYGTTNVMFGVATLAQTTLRSVLGTMSLDETLSNREVINARLLDSLDRETEKWGIKVLRVEIKRLDPPHDIQDSMSKQMKAEREKRASILEAEAYKQGLITRSEGDRQSQILQAEGQAQAQILHAEGEAKAQILLAEAAAKSLELESLAAQTYFKDAAVTKEQLSVIQNALGGGNTKYILDSDILTSISKAFGIK